MKRFREAWCRWFGHRWMLLDTQIDSRTNIKGLMVCSRCLHSATATVHW